MIRPSTLPFVALGLAAALTPLSSLAQDPADAGDATVRQAVVYGGDECAPSDDNEIIVCLRLPEGERYRVPDILRGDVRSPENTAWANKIERIERVSKFGTDSCSPAGAGGFTGCLGQLIDDAYDEKRQDARVDWTAAIAAERQKRIDAIDGKARAAEEAYLAQEANKETREAEMATARARLATQRGETPATATTPPAPANKLAVPPRSDETPDEPQ